MKRDYFKFCPRCAGRLVWKRGHREDPALQQCVSCGFIFYDNQIAAAEAYIVRHGKLLMVRRSQPPRKGWYDVPGGFLSGFESPRDGVIREIKEELNCTFIPKAQLGAYGCDHYPWKGKDYAVVTIAFTGMITGTPRVNHEIASLEWIPLNRIPKRIAFPHALDSIKDLRRYLKT